MQFSLHSVEDEERVPPPRHLSEEQPTKVTVRLQLRVLSYTCVLCVVHFFGTYFSS